ncbi:MAG TPA: hypothetical protein VFH13_07035 [Gemmatimonadaceae bacterium]|nr:hypothetical protein [Gemmatimonadaceae bacterium]
MTNQKFSPALTCRLVQPTSPARWVGATALLLSLAGCRQVAPAFGPNIPGARQNAEEFFYSIGSRFTNIQRPPRIIHARAQFGHYALTPSGIYNDTSIWLAVGPDSTRIFGDEGRFAYDRYIVTARLSNTQPDALTESREIIRLRKLSGNEYEWFTNVDVALGRIGARHISAVLAAALEAGEGRSPAAIRADYTTNFPRTTAALSRLFRIDTLRATPDSEGATTYDLAIRLTPDILKATMPQYAAYIDKYIGKGTYRITLTDKAGARWFDARAANYYVHFKVRSKGGHFAPLDGAVRPMPEALTIRLDMSMKILIFTVGWTDMRGEFNVINTPHERGWAMRFAREPEWRLPPTVGRLLKSPLRRPFQGQGIPVRISIRDNPGSQTLLNRRGTLVVQESGILRFLNRLSGTAVGDFLGPAERQANRFNADAFRALRADVAAILQ